MAEHFDIEINYKGQERIFPAEFQSFGYMFKIKVTIDEKDFIFERDEEKQYRAIVPYEELDKTPGVDRELLGAIIEKLQEIL